jgi:hypothetical protein
MLKSLRKNYITQLHIFKGAHIKDFTGHSTEDVIDQFYLDLEIKSIELSKTNFTIQ